MGHPLGNSDTYGDAGCDTRFLRAELVFKTLAGVRYLQKQIGGDPATAASGIHCADTFLGNFVAADDVSECVHKAGDLFLRTPRGEGQNGKRQPGSLPQNKDHLDPPLGVLRLVLIGG